MKIICANRNEKDFQSMIFDTNLSWEELKYFIIKRIAFDGHIINKTMYRFYIPKCFNTTSAG